MQFIDFGEVMKAAREYTEGASAPIQVSVYVDETAPADCVAHVRGLLAGGAANVRVTLTYLDPIRVVADPRDDMAVIIAGTSSFVGEAAENLRFGSTPVMVATTMPSLVAEIAKEAGHPIPDGDIVSPLANENSRTMNLVERGASIAGKFGESMAQMGKNAEDVSASDAEKVAGVADTVGAAAAFVGDAAAKKSAPASDEVEEPIVLTKENEAVFDKNMGKWVVAACEGKRLAFASAFNFVRSPMAEDAIQNTAVQNAAIGLVAIIPGADMPLMTLNQAKMLLQIAIAYGQPLTTDRVKELAAIVASGFAFRAVARQGCTLVPGLGWGVKAAVGYTGTLAMGRAAVDYFEGGAGMDGLSRVLLDAQSFVLSTAAKIGGPLASSAAKAGARGVSQGLGTLARSAVDNVTAKVPGKGAQVVDSEADVDPEAAPADKKGATQIVGGLAKGLAAKVIPGSRGSKE